MVFKQRDFIVKRSTVVDFLYARSNVYYRDIDEENEAALSLFCEPFLRKTNFAYK